MSEKFTLFPEIWDDTGVMLILFVVVCVIGYGTYQILRSPFHYPHFIYKFDVSGKRNVDVNDYIDKFLCKRENWKGVVEHQEKIRKWKREKEEYLQTCILKEWRKRQYRDAIDAQKAFQFITVRSQTRYRQRNYIKESYKVSVQDKEKCVSYEWVKDRYAKLANIGFECILKEYHAREQRKIMTPTLRKKIMERDNYTCKNCGRHMPDKFGLEIDHIIPVSKGGKSIPSNL